MKKSPHHKFVDELQERLIADTPRQGRASKNNNRVPGEDVCKEDIMRELERKFDELFGNPDDDD